MLLPCRSPRPRPVGGRATVLGSGMATMDFTVVGIALPTIGRQFHTGVADLQWVTNGYTLTLAGLLLLGGAGGDRYGCRQAPCIGMVWFAVASLLVRPRAERGVPHRLPGAARRRGGAADPGEPGHPAGVLPASDRARAIGAWSGLGGVAVAAGPLLGGCLIWVASWRWIFFINLPLAALVVGRAHGTSPSCATPRRPARSITRARRPQRCSCPASPSRSSRPRCWAGRRPRC